MKLGRLIFLSLIALLTILPVASQTKKVPSPEVVYAKCKASVVTILTFDVNRAPLTQGSGFIIAKNQVVTNYHVIAGSNAASIVFSDGSISIVTSVIAASAPKDLAIVETNTGNRAALVLGNELQLNVGETIYAIGAPKGLPTSLSSGLVSAFRQDEGQFLIQITAPIAPGSSGGPLLNGQGEVVGVATSRLGNSNFGFAMGAGDVQHLIKAPLTVKLSLSDLRIEDTSPDELGSVQALFDQKKYDDARAGFNALSESAKTSFDAQVLLCKIDQGRKDYRLAIQSCDAAIRTRPNAGTPYGLNAYSLLMLGETEQAEDAASKAANLSDEIYYKQLLGLIHYSEGKYDLVPKEISTDSNDAFVLTLLAGAAFHNKDYDGFRSLRTKVTALKGEANGWTLFLAGLTAEKELKWDAALEKYKKCDDDSDFIDPICIIGVTRTELMKADYSSAKSAIDSAVRRFPNSRDVLSEGIFVNLVVGNSAEADRLHKALKGTASGSDDATDCLYYYGRNQPLLADSPCQASIKAHGDHYVAWSNAGYVALDIGDFQSSLSYFSKAWQLFYAAKEKHTVTQELDVWWGTLTAEYYSGDRKGAKKLYQAVRKEYPEFLTMSALKQLPLVWSEATTKLIEKIMVDLK